MPKPTEQPSPGDNLRKYKAQLGNITKDKGQPYWDAVKDGMELLAKEENTKVISITSKKDPAVELKDKLTADLSNPYEKARIKVLVDMSPTAKQEIAEMEASGNKDHYRYKEFVRMIIQEAEKTC